ncbi:MAG: DUF1835 domain-containing protein [Gammaproteobacteria bacterium]|nr:DUF1835 domain-containing protein [Gammaproteobacteria bacterium]
MTAPDADLRTLHIRCGSDIQGTLGEAGFVGDFVEFADPFCTGPVRDLPQAEFIAERSRFIADAFLIDPQVVEQKQHRGYAALTRLDEYERVVLWFEHDSFDQLILAYLLMRIGQTQPSAVVELVAVDHFPGIDRFIGLGQLNGEQIASLWPKRQVVTDAQYRLGTEVWSALIQASPEPLHALAQTGTPALPMMSRAIGRHLRELPDLRTGLGLTERLILEIARDLGPLRIGRAFGELTSQREPLPFLGDIMFAWIVRRLTHGATPLLELHPAPDPLKLDRWGMRDEIALTGTGHAVLAGIVSGLDAASGPRWVGGVPLPGSSGTWCRDDTTGHPVLTG